MINSVQAMNDKFSITVRNDAWFLAEFYVTYTVNNKNYNLDSGIFSKGTLRTLSMPKNVEFAYITIDFIWVGAHHLYNQVDLNLADNCFNLTGTIFQPKVEQVNCNTLGGNGSNNTNNKCCCCCSCCKK